MLKFQQYLIVNITFSQNLYFYYWVSLKLKSFKTVKSKKYRLLAQLLFSRLDSIGPGRNVLSTWTRIANWHLSATLMTTKTVCDILEILWTTRKNLFILSGISLWVVKLKAQLIIPALLQLSNPPQAYKLDHFDLVRVLKYTCQRQQFDKNVKMFQNVTKSRGSCQQA